MVGDAVGGGRDSGSVGNRGNGSQRLGRLEVSQSLTLTASVDARRNHVVTLTDFECTILGLARGIVCTPETIIDVLAKLALVVAIRVTNFDTKGMAAHEADRDEDMLTAHDERNLLGPVANLLVGIVVAIVARKSIRVHETTERVATLNERLEEIPHRINEQTKSAP